MFVKTFHTGGDRNLAYLVADDRTNDAVVIDPSYAPEVIVAFAQQNGYHVVYAFCTHDHHDHTNGNPEFERITGIRPLLFGDRDAKSGTLVEDNVTFPFGDLVLRILHAPGHTPDSICLLVEDAIFTGDTLFVGKVGGTDLGDGAEREYGSLQQVLMKLPDDTRVFPGHDVGIASESTIGRERETNPFLLRPNLESFVDLKRNWATYKKEHGIA